MLIRNLCLFIALLSWLSSAACQSGNAGTAAIDANGGGDSDGNVSGTCDFTNCEGCCDGNTCVVPVRDDACGQAGSVCQPCAGSDICSAGLCVSPTEDCSGCASDGCCLDGIQCHEGNSPTACGVDGDACQRCPLGQSCSSGSCVENVCNADVCPDGCCDSAGECKNPSEQDLGLCGTGGAACTGCPSDALACTLGTCVLDQPCLDFCNGGCCTAQGQCIPFDDQVQEDTCGTTTCAPCAGDLSCIAGTCTEDPVWEITIRNLIIAPLDPDGDEWDGFFSTTGPEPDPYVKSGLDDPAIGFFPQGLTDRITDTHTPNWTAATQRTYSHLESTLVEKGLKFQIRDYDGALPPAEQVGNCTSPISMADLSAGTKTIATCGESVTNLRIDFALQ